MSEPKTPEKKIVKIVPNAPQKEKVKVDYGEKTKKSLNNLFEFIPPEKLVITKTDTINYLEKIPKDQLITIIENNELNTIKNKKIVTTRSFES